MGSREVSGGFGMSWVSEVVGTKALSQLVQAEMGGQEAELVLSKSSFCCPNAGCKGQSRV